MTTLAELRAIGPFPAMQIVPTWDDHELLSHPVDAAAPVGALTYHGGRLLTSYRTVLCFLDAFPYDKADFTAFVTAITQDGYVIAPDGVVRNGVFGGAVSVLSGFSSTVDDSAIQAFVDGQAGKGLPADDGNTVYLLVMPAGSTVTMQGASSCSTFCGYHSKSAGGHLYAVLCDPSCSGCHGNITPYQGLCLVTGHELGETVSDPEGTGWYSDQTGSEDGDECAWQPNPWGPQGQWAVQPLAVGHGQGQAWTCTVAPYTPQAQPQPQPKLTLVISGPSSVVVGQGGSYSAALAPPDPAATYSWRVNGVTVTTGQTFGWLPAAAGTFTIDCLATSQGQQVLSNPLAVVVLANTPGPPPSGGVTKAQVDASQQGLVSALQALAQQYQGDSYALAQITYAMSIVSYDEQSVLDPLFGPGAAPRFGSIPPPLPA